MLPASALEFTCVRMSCSSLDMQNISLRMILRYAEYGNIFRPHVKSCREARTPRQPVLHFYVARLRRRRFVFTPYAASPAAATGAAAPSTSRPLGKGLNSMNRMKASNTMPSRVNPVKVPVIAHADSWKMMVAMTHA